VRDKITGQMEDRKEPGGEKSQAPASPGADLLGRFHLPGLLQAFKGGGFEENADK